MIDPKIHPASFRDPAGFVFLDGGRYLRQVNQQYAGAYERLMQSGLYEELVKRCSLIPHEFLPNHNGPDGKAYKVLLPQQLEWITYPYEWTFDMLKDAALLTLSIQQSALNHGMILKDASAYNIQFVDGKPMWIDSLSFEPLDAEQPWVAYRQFCQHFLFPLLIGHYKGIRAQQWLQLYLDGLPVDLTASLLPWHTRFRLGTAMHVHLQHKYIRKRSSAPANHTFSLRKFHQLASHLGEVIRRLKWPDKKTVWGDYYESTILSQAYLGEKTEILEDLMKMVQAQTVIDLGANSGHFSRLLLKGNRKVLAVDNDHLALNRFYQSARKDSPLPVQILITDLLNPSPGIGWSNNERSSFNARFKADLVLALALVHHLYFTGAIPLPRILGEMARLSSGFLIIEFVTIDDPKVKEISANKIMTCQHYSVEFFEAAARPFFSVESKIPLAAGNRILYLMKKIIE
jgi:SAM-dependent methyltransferase